MKFGKLLVAGLWLAASTSVASATLYECDLKKGPSGWTPEKIFIKHETGAPSAIVVDGLIQHYNGGPTTARVVNDNNKIVSFKWTVVGQDITQKRINMLYRATFYRSKGRLDLFAKPAGFSNQFGARGPCKVS